MLVPQGSSKDEDRQAPKCVKYKGAKQGFPGKRTHTQGHSDFKIFKDTALAWPNQKTAAGEYGTQMLASLTGSQLKSRDYRNRPR